MSAWTPLSFEEDDFAWRAFSRQLQFRPSPYPDDWPAIREPTPSRVFAIRWAMTAPTRDRLLGELEQWSISAFRRCTPFGGRLLTLSWQHVSWWLDPFADDLAAPTPDDYSPDSTWAVQLLPNGRYVAVMSDDLTNGVFGDPWEGILCVWGAPLMQSLEHHRPALLRDLVRANGGTVA